MLIKSGQIQTLNAYAEDIYVKEMAGHLQLFSPKLCQVVGEPALLQLTKSGMDKGRGYGLMNHGPLRFFLELKCTLGSGFDTDPQLHWASEVLSDTSIDSDMLRAERLFERMIGYLDQVAGPNHQYATEAIKSLLAYNFDTPPPEGWSDKAVVGAMARLYPQKFEFVGESAAKEIARQAAKQAAKYGLPHGPGGAALAGMKFGMGHGICEDPFYPWIEATLLDPQTVDGEGRLARLLSKLRLYGTHVLAYFNPS